MATENERESVSVCAHADERRKRETLRKDDTQMHALTHIIAELIHIVALLHETGILDVALEHAREMVELVLAFVG